MEHTDVALMEQDGERLVPHVRASYDGDVHAWAMQQAELIRLGRFHELDITNLADEVEDVARRERRELVSRLSLVYQHLLKWEHQPGRRTASWARTIREQRRQVDDWLDENRSLRPYLGALTEVAYRQGRVSALNETGLDDVDIPETNTLTWDDAMTRPIVWPEP